MAKRWTRGDSWSLIAIACISIAGIALSQVAEGPKVYAVIAVALGFALIAGAITWAVFRAKSTVQVDYDDGGVRIRHRDHYEYVPYARLRRVYGRRSFGRTVLHLDDRALPLADGHGTEHEDVIPERVAAARAPQPSASLMSFARGGRPLDVWLERVREGDGYRGAAVDREELLRVALDRTADIELRAAAVHKILSSQDEDAKTRVRETIARSMPPLVLLAASLAIRRGDYVPGLEDAKDFISKDDLAAAERLADARPRVRVGTDDPTVEAVDAVEEHSAEERHRAR